MKKIKRSKIPWKMSQFKAGPDVIDPRGIRVKSKILPDNFPYAITSSGFVWSFTSKRFLKPSHNGNGYLIAHIGCKGKEYQPLISRLVAIAFIKRQRGSPDSVVDHIDKNTYNNDVSNLRWLSLKKNHASGGRVTKIPLAERKEIFDKVERGEYSLQKIAEQHKTTRIHINKIYRSYLKYVQIQERLKSGWDLGKISIDLNMTVRSIRMKIARCKEKPNYENTISCSNSIASIQ